MQVTNAIKKLSNVGFSVTQSGNCYRANTGSKVIEFHQQNGEIICIRVRSANDHDDVMSDYSAGTWCDNLSQAIRLAA